jgi:hypothetical protein
MVQEFVNCEDELKRT